MGGPDVELQETKHGYHPPSYNDDPPPSYQSLFGRIKSAKKESKGNVDYGKKIMALVFYGIPCTVLMLVLLFGLPAAMLYFGITYRTQCPLEPMIPMYLLVAGCAGILTAIMRLLKQIADRGKSNEEVELSLKDSSAYERILSCSGCLLGCFMLAWFIAGSVWVYSNKDRRADCSTYNATTAVASLTTPAADLDSCPTYCHPTLFLFAFWTITVQYILMLIPIALGCGACMIGICCSGKS